MNELDQRLYARRLKRHDIGGIVDVFDANYNVSLGRLVNIHEEGLMVMGDIHWQDEKIYQIDLHLPELIDGRSIIHLGVDCLWSRASDDNTKHWAGCLIIDASKQAKADIKKLISILGE